MNQSYPSRRLASVDALRGCTVAAMLLVNNPGDWGHVFAPLRHAAWHGWTPTDLIFPFFLFIVGTSLSLSVGARLSALHGDPARESGMGAIRRSVVLRGVRVFLLGLLLNVLAWWWLDQPSLRWPGVLQRIGLCLALAGLVVTQWRARGQGIWLALLLVGYGALLILGGTLEPLHDVASRVDAWLLGPHAYRWNASTGLGRDPEGALSTLGALATVLLGYRCGEWLREGKVVRIAVLGGGAAVIGWALDASGVMPINKALWTPSFVLWTGGCAALLLALLHRLMDRHGWPPVGRRLGMNAIAAYAGAWVMSIGLAASGLMAVLYPAVFGWVGRWLGAEAQSLSFALAFVGFWWLVALGLDRRKIYFKL